MREFPQESLNACAHLFNHVGGRVIVEIGGLAKLPDDAEFALYGGSTLVWLHQTQAELIYSVDINEHVARQTANLTSHDDRVRVIVRDGIAFLGGYEGPIDLLYLDAWDAIAGTPYKQKHLDAFNAAAPHLHAQSMVLIDDTDIDQGGKGQLVIPAALDIGFNVWWSGRQTLLARRPVPVCDDVVAHALKL